MWRLYWVQPWWWHQQLCLATTFVPCWSDRAAFLLWCMHPCRKIKYNLSCWATHNGCAGDDAHPRQSGFVSPYMCWFWPILAQSPFHHFLISGVHAHVSTMLMSPLICCRSRVGTCGSCIVSRLSCSCPSTA